MKIGINARFLSKPFTGIGQYTQNLLKELAKIDLGNEYVFVMADEIDEKLKKEFSKNASFHHLPEKGRGTAGIKKTWWEQIQLPDFFKKEKCEMVLYPYPSNPWVNSWYKKGIKTVVAVHDCIPWVSKSYRKKMLSRMYNYQAKKAIKKADLVLTVSNTSKKEIEKLCKIDSSKIKVIYNDAGDVFKKDEYNDGVLSKFNLKKGGYFLYVGGYDERKNVKMLLRDYSSFSKENDEVLPLVLVGGKQINNYLYSSFEGKDPEYGKVVRTGFLDGEDLVALYSNALAFVNLSSYEGFNIPIVEAANCYCPIIISDTDTHREVANGHALFVDILKNEEVVQALKKLSDENIKERYSKKAKELASKFSWKESAKKLKEVVILD